MADEMLTELYKRVFETKQQQARQIDMSNIDTDDIYNVVVALIGETNPVGETHTDNLRYDNLRKLTALTDMLLSDIDAIATNYKNNHEFSMKRASKFCSDFYDYIGIK